MLYIPPKMLVHNRYDWPHFFFLGPVRGGGDWQIPGFPMLRDELDIAGLMTKYYVSIPCRWPDNNPIAKFRARGMTDYHKDQLSWEITNIRRAAKLEKKGCAIMWLCKEPHPELHTWEDSYAMDSRREVGKMTGIMINDPDWRFVLGAEEGFLGLSQIKRDLSIELGYDYPIYPTLRETIRAGVKMMQEKCP